MSETEPEFSWSKRGRKKSHPVWSYFEDLRSITGADMIKCKHCEFETPERNPSTLTTHLKKSHSQGRGSIWHSLEEQSGDCGKFRSTPKSGSIARLISGNKQTDLLEELTKEVATHGSVRMDKNDIVGLLQNFITKADPNEASNIENLVTALNDPSKNDSITAGGSDELADEDDDGPIGGNRLSEDWNLYGTYYSFEDVENVRNARKVVRHSVIPMKEGSKVKYRCGTWKRTHCPYRMYYVELNQIYTLYEKGEHVHTPVKPKPSTSRDRHIDNNAYDDHFISTDYLQSIISHAIQSTAIEPKKEPIVISEFSSHPPAAEEKRDTEISSSLTLPENLLNVLSEAVRNEPGEHFSLSSGDSISSLLQVATEHQLVFTFDARNAAEFCFSKANNPISKVIVFVDQGSEVIARIKVNDAIASEERWKKADSSQFYWAVRGVLAKSFPPAP